ncbi:MAG: SMI1/KNR4 family protein [Gammaproteobacteria bacterium]
MEIREQLQTLIHALIAAKNTYDQLVFDEQYPVELGPPATPEQIAALEQLLGKALPDSYRAFLQLHNGWSDFEGDGKLLGTDDHAAEWVQEKIQYWNDLWDMDSDNPFEHGAMPVMLGEGLNHFLVLDPRRVNQQGQPLFVLYDYMHEEKSYEDFTGYLQNRLSILRRLIDRETNGIPEESDGE